jgi:hypothetical protein
MRKGLLAGITVNVALLVALLGYVASLSVPASEATRLRNALLLDVASRADTEWTPDAVPISFKAERLPASTRFRAIVSALGVDRMEGDWSKAVALADHLTRNSKDLGAIQSDLTTAYGEITQNGKGYCADYTQVYLGLAHAAGLFAREWAFSFDGFGGYGHTLIEVFDRRRGRWLWLDVYNNVHAIDPRTGEPLSALEFRSYASGAREYVVIQRNGPGRLGYKYPEKLIEYYRRGADEWYLWAGNAVFTYESSLLVRAGAIVARPAEQLLAILAGVHPRIRAIVSDRNAGKLEKMAQLRNTLRVVLVSWFALLCFLLWQLWMLRRLRIHRDVVARSGTAPA